MGETWQAGQRVRCGGADSGAARKLRVAAGRVMDTGVEQLRGSAGQRARGDLYLAESVAQQSGDSG